MTYETDNEYRAQVAAWVARHVDTPVDRRVRPGGWVLNVYYAADHAEALAVNETRAPRTATYTFEKAAAASLALARSIDPAVLQAQIAAQNTPEKLAATRSRLARYRRNRERAEAAYYAEHGK